MLRTTTLLIGLMLVAAIAWGDRPHASARSLAASQRCAAAKLRAAGYHAYGTARCMAVGTARGVGTSPACRAKQRSRFELIWHRAEYEWICGAGGTLAAVETTLDAFDGQQAARLRLAGAPSRCSAGKARDGGKAAQCRLGCAARAIAKQLAPSSPKLLRCIDGCRLGLMVGFARDESHPDCRTRGDGAAVDSAVGAFAACATAVTTDPAAPPCDGSASSTTVTTTTTTSTSSAGSTSTIGGSTTTHTATTTQTSSTAGASSSTTTSASTSSSGSTTSTVGTTTSTLLPCGGVYPVCLGSCPAGQVCVGDGLLAACGCATTTTTAAVTTTTTSTTTTAAPATTTTTTSSSTITSTTNITTTSTTTTTLLPCGGVAPVCLGGCPAGQTCTGAALSPCTCQ